MTFNAKEHRAVMCYRPEVGYVLYMVDDAWFMRIWRSLMDEHLEYVQEIPVAFANSLRSALHTPVDDARLHWISFKVC